MIRVVGTAGHVDHGKSTLVEALTGMNPDRLREEREREMTIDLGFAWLTLPGGTEVGFVDVPGHRDFIDNMLAGVGGIDAALLVIAADEGVMPQTREHVAILDLLGIPRVLVALSKVDLIEDPEWMRLVEEEVRQLLRPTSFAGADVLPVSARSGEGLEALARQLEDLLEEVPARPDRGRPRLPIDRAFTMTGFGTVVTGTLLDGSLRVGDDVVVLPDGAGGRVRGLQTHRRAEASAPPGRRVAVNLAGLEVDHARRGDVVCAPGAYQPTNALDVHVRVLPDAPIGIRHDQRLKLHLGSADVVVRARVLMRDQIRPGEEGWLQLILERPLVAAEADRFILRRPAPPSTLAGGEVVVVHPERRHRRKDAGVVETLERLAGGRPEDRLHVMLVDASPASASELAESLPSSIEATMQALATLEAQGRARRIGQGDDAPVFVESGWWERLAERARAVVTEYHAGYPLRWGMPREEFRGRVGAGSRSFDIVLAALGEDGVIEVHGGRVGASAYVPRLDVADEARVEGLRRAFGEAPYAPPSVKACVAAVGPEVWGYLVAAGEFVIVSEDVALAEAIYRRLVSDVVAALEAGEEVSVASVRDRFGTSRKYALALLEHLDSIGVSTRKGDVRVRGPAASPTAQPSRDSDR